MGELGEENCSCGGCFSNGGKKGGDDGEDDDGDCNDDVDGGTFVTADCDCDCISGMVQRGLFPAFVFSFLLPPS